MNFLIRLSIILIILIIPLSLSAKIRDYISIKAQRDISLSDLIISSGFEIEDDKVVPFLENFSRLNEDPNLPIEFNALPFMRLKSTF